jgi:hypothetical protein
MFEPNVIAPSDAETPSATLRGRQPFVAPRVENLGDLTTLTLLGGSL